MDKKVDSNKTSTVALRTLELIKGVVEVESIEGMDEELLEGSKRKAIESLCEYAKAQITDLNLWKYPLVSTPDFGAYFRYDEDKEEICLVFRQETPTNTMHSYFSSPEEMIQGIAHLYGRPKSDTEHKTL